MITLNFLILYVFVSSCTSALTWVQKQSMLYPRSDFIAVSIGSKAYIYGGCTADELYDGTCNSITNKMTVYDFTTDQFTEVTTGPRNRYRYSAAAVGPKIYYVGGRTLLDDVIAEVDVYDTEAHTWTTLQDQGGLTSNSDGAAFVIGSKLYVTGGYDELYNTLASTIVLDTAGTTLLFTQTNVAPKLVAAGDNGAVSIGGFGYVFGGYGALVGENVSWCQPLGYLEKYDPTANTWTLLSSLLHYRGDMAFAVLNDKLFIMGGETKMAPCGNSTPTVQVEYYDPVKDQWSDISPIAIERFRFSGTGYEGFIYDFGGQGEQTDDHYPVLSDVYALDVTSILNASLGTSISPLNLLILLILSLLPLLF